MRIVLASLVPFASLLAACSGDDGASCTNCDDEVITTVILNLTPTGGSPSSYEVDDPDGDGGDPPTIDTIPLMAGTTYAVTVQFQNRLEAPPEEITDEVRDEGVDHQIFFTGTAVDGPASDQPAAPIAQTYADTDADGLPIGLSDTFVVRAGSPSNLTVTLRHMPPINGQKVKTADAAASVKSGGFSTIGGDNDANVTFPVTISVP